MKILVAEDFCLTEILKPIEESQDDYCILRGRVYQQICRLFQSTL